MSTVSIGSLQHHSLRENPKYSPKSKAFKPCSLNCSLPTQTQARARAQAQAQAKLFFHSRRFCNFFRAPKHSHVVVVAKAASTTETAVVQTFESADLFFKETFPLNRTETVRFLFLFIFCLVPEKMKEFKLDQMTIIVKD